MVIHNSFSKVLEKITVLFENENIRWAIFAGLGANAYGSNREVTDIDIIFLEEDTKKVEKIVNLLGGEKMIYYDDEIFECLNTMLNIFEKEVDISTNLKITIDNKKYFFMPDKEMFEKSRKLFIDGVKVPVLSPEDIIIFKAITQRGQEQGKFDVFDVKNILEKQEIDFDYLYKRAEICKAKERVTKLINSIKN